MGFLLLLMYAVLAVVTADKGAFIGVNIGTALSDMPNQSQVVQLLKAQQIRHVRLYDADKAMLLALAKTGIHVTVSIPNDKLLGVGQSNATAANWVARNVVAHYPATKIIAIAVGSEILSVFPDAAPHLVSALKHLHNALLASNLDKQIKVSTLLPSSIILDSFPPSQAPSLTDVIPLDYALFRPLTPSKDAVDSNTHLHYTNVFDSVIDATYFAMAYLNITNVPIVVTESGWPSRGDASEPDATIDNANTYNSNLIRHVLNNTGTPMHPGVAVSTYLYELYNEDMRPGLVSEKNWGLFDANGVPIYFMRLTGTGSLFARDTAYKTYCIARDGADQKMLQAGLDWVCSQGKLDCSSMFQGQPCFLPNTVAAHASVAFNMYCYLNGMGPENCNFKGVASITTTDPITNGTTIPDDSLGSALDANVFSSCALLLGCFIFLQVIRI
ncbi:hypothetical protein MKW92_004281 [Papaver armeniacum]|nr:hypothetical protein MKW92_004281 [Papaver armeniacum]